jgi:hypothetical protein
MGSTAWRILAPYDVDPDKALRVAQAEYFDQNYDLPVVLVERIQATEQAVRSTEEDDPYDLHSHYLDALTELRKLASQAWPADVHEQIRLLRRIQAIGSSEVGNILDVVGVSRDPRSHGARPLTSDELQSIFDTDQPTRNEAETRMYRVFDLINAGESICFPVFCARRPRVPVGWYFVGYTVD